jgi:hypothetical protein
MTKEKEVAKEREVVQKDEEIRGLGRAAASGKEKR